MNSQPVLLKPLGWGKSILYFGIPTLILHLIFAVVMRVLDVVAFRLFTNFLLAFGVPSFLLLFAALWFYRRDGFPRNMTVFKQRFRLESPTAQVWIWSAVLSVLWIGGFYLFQPVSDWIQANWISAPKLWIRMLAADSDYFMEIPTNNPLVPVGLILFVLLNVLGQQLFWRGYVFPRQELAFGNSTWIIHGLLWTITLSFLIWDIAFILFASLTLSYTVQRVKSTWPALIAHAATLIVIFWIHPLFLPN